MAVASVPIVPLTAYQLATRFLGLQEGPGTVNHPQVLAMLRLDAAWVQGDDTAWCSAFVNYICWLLDLPRSKSLAARSWLAVGRPIPAYAPGSLGAEVPGDVPQIGFDLVILKRGVGPQPGPEVLDAFGHVGFFAGWQGEKVLVLAGNQHDGVSIEAFSPARILGIRRLLG